MKQTLTLVGSILLGALLKAGRAEIAGICTSLTYADGGLYCRENNDGICKGDLGDFPAQRSFPWYVEWAENGNLYLLEHLESRTYIKYTDMLYLDASPGAFAPLRFTPDNSTLAPGETSWAWFSVYGGIMWTPTGDPLDGTPNSEGKVRGQGFEFVDVPGYPGLKQAYWNQTLFDLMYEGKASGNGLAFCHGDYSAVFIEGDRP
ncbi:hypothetical protein VTO42DRAFT_2260 [Malbranchea cinnamomea]